MCRSACEVVRTPWTLVRPRVKCRRGTPSPSRSAAWRGRPVAEGSTRRTFGGLGRRRTASFYGIARFCETERKFGISMVRTDILELKSFPHAPPDRSSARGVEPIRRSSLPSLSPPSPSLLRRRVLRAALTYPPPSIHSTTCSSINAIPFALRSRCG